MLMSKNVNNDVSKDSPTELASKRKEKKVTLGLWNIPPTQGERECRENRNGEEWRGHNMRGSRRKNEPQ